MSGPDSLQIKKNARCVYRTEKLTTYQAYKDVKYAYIIICFLHTMNTAGSWYDTVNITTVFLS